MSPAPTSILVRRLTLGVLGHVDHGKTALVRALTGMETDRLPEEKARGVSIALGFAHARFGDALSGYTEIDFIDMPGHERFVRTMVSGATGIDAALLVVAANEGVKPQTLEHLEIAALLRIRAVLPVIAKADLVPPEDAQAAGARTLDLLASLGLASLPPVAVSVVTGAGLIELAAALATLAETGEPLPDDGLPWLPIDRAFISPGRGTVVTGTLRRGRLTASDELALLPSGAPARVRGLQVHGITVEAAAPGQRLAVNLRGVEAGEVGRGAALASPGLLSPSRRLTVALEVPSSAPALPDGARLQLLVGTAEVPARVRLLDRKAVEPGEAAMAQLEAARPVAVPARERFVLRWPSPARTAGGGEVVDPDAPRLSRRDPAVLRRWAALAAAPPAARVRLVLDEAGWRGEAAARLVQLCGLGPARLEAALANQKAWRAPDGRWLDGAAADALAQAAWADVGRRPDGATLQALAEALAPAAASAVEGALARLARRGLVVKEAGRVRPAPAPDQAAARAKREAQAAADLSRRLREAALQPPDLADLAAAPEGRRALERLFASGEAVRLVDRVQKREFAFHRDALADARRRLLPLLAPPGLTVGEIGAALGLTRKWSVPLLEYLDTRRVTRRVGERRVLGPEAGGG